PAQLAVMLRLYQRGGGFDAPDSLRIAGQNRPRRLDIVELRVLAAHRPLQPLYGLVISNGLLDNGALGDEDVVALQIVQSFQLDLQTELNIGQGARLS